MITACVDGNRRFKSLIISRGGSVGSSGARIPNLESRIPKPQRPWRLLTLTAITKIFRNKVSEPIDDEFDRNQRIQPRSAAFRSLHLIILVNDYMAHQEKKD